MAEKFDIEQSLADTIIERPNGFKVNGRQFYLYPITLGKTYVISRLISDLGVNKDNININPYLEAIRLSQDKKNEAIRLIAYHTLRTKEEVFDLELIEERIKYLSELDRDEIAQLLMVILIKDNIEPYLKYLNIDKEKEDQAKVLKCKKADNTTYTFGGKSIYGTMIDYLAERYGWTMDYILWGISYDNLQLLMADTIVHIHLTEEEAKKCRVSKERSVINADDPKNQELIRKMFS